MRRVIFLSLASLSLLRCGSPTVLADGGSAGGSSAMGGGSGGSSGGGAAGGGDGGMELDAGEDDGGFIDLDGGVVEEDAGTQADAGEDDAGIVDAGTSDAGVVDAGAGDAGVSDAGAADAGTADAGTADAGTTDAGTTDAGTTDAGTTDAGSGPCNTLVNGATRTVTCQMTPPNLSGGTLVPGRYVLSAAALVRTTCPATTGLVAASALDLGPGAGAITPMARVRSLQQVPGLPVIFRETRSVTTLNATMTLAPVCPATNPSLNGSYESTSFTDGGVQLRMYINENNAQFLYTYTKR